MRFVPQVLQVAAILVFGVVLFVTIDAVATITAHETLTWTLLRFFPAISGEVIVAWFWEPLLFAVFWVALLRLRGPAKKPERADFRVALLSLLIGFLSYTKLAAYQPFAGHVPFILGLLLWVAALVALYAMAVYYRERWISAAAGIGTVSLSIGVVFLNYHQYRGLYPTLHETLIYISFASMLVGTYVALERVVQKRPRIAGVLFVVALVVLGIGLGSPQKASKQHRHFCEIGRVLPSEPKVLSTPNEVVEEDADALKRFATHSGFPSPPSHFAIDDFNILLIGVEATRFDVTSLADRSKDLTPNLAKHAEDGLVFERAYSPSSGTLHTIASMLTMKYASSTKLTTWMKPWNGELAEEEVTVAELLKDVRYDRWWIGHNYQEAFTNSLLGLTQGFGSVELFVEYQNEKADRTDELIADKTREHLELYAQHPDQKFFGFVFLVSPHGPYVAHGYDMPARTARQRYEQEVKYADEQFGRIFDTLESTGLSDRTVVVYFSDHGEEFREHGGVRHKSTVYTESIHVPLVVWIPGMKPARTDAVTSTMYAFPYLLQTARDDGLRQSIETYLRSYLGPMIRETDGGVVSELIGHDRIKATVITQRSKINHDYRSGLFELYDLETDPGERIDVWDSPSHAATQSAMQKRFDAYDRIRGAFFKHAFLPTKLTPPLENTSVHRKNGD